MTLCYFYEDRREAGSEERLLRGMIEFPDLSAALTTLGAMVRLSGGAFVAEAYRKGWLDEAHYETLLTALTAPPLGFETSAPLAEILAIRDEILSSLPLRSLPAASMV